MQGSLDAMSEYASAAKLSKAWDVTKQVAGQAVLNTIRYSVPIGLRCQGGVTGTAGWVGHARAMTRLPCAHTVKPCSTVLRS